MFNPKLWAQAVIKARGDMTQKEFASVSGVTRATLGKMESGKYPHKPSIDLVIKISRASTAVSLREIASAADCKEELIELYETSGSHKHLIERIIKVIDQNNIEDIDENIADKIIKIIEILIK